MLIEFIIILALILLNGVFAASEIAIVSSKKARLQVQADKKNPAAVQAIKLKEAPNRFFSTVQIGITLIGILTGIFGGTTIAQRLAVYLNKMNGLASYSHELSVILIVILITFLSLVLGELVPKRIGMAIPEKYAMIIALPMSLLSKIMGPFVWLLSYTTDFIVRLLNIKTSKNTATEEEIKAMVDEGATTGAIQEIEHEIVDRVFSLGDKKAINLMTHRSHLTWLDIHDDYQENKKVIAATNFSIYPVCDGTPDNIIGVLSIKKLLKDYLGDREPAALRQLIDPLNFVHENSSAYNILEKFRTSKLHHAFVLDEYGSVEGMITLNDILSSLVGDISEINDRVEDSKVVVREDGSWLIDGQYAISDVLELLDIQPTASEDTAGINTLAGLILLKLGHLPQAGHKMSWNGYCFEVMDMDGYRIDKVLVSKENIDL